MGNLLPGEDERTLQRLGYKQELSRGLGAFSNFALSLSIICILAGGLTSFHIGFCSAGGASIGLGWPLCCLMSLAVAATMGQVASAFPTAGGLYHWAAILGGRGWGWLTAWFNLAGLITVLAAINFGTVSFAISAFAPGYKIEPVVQILIVAMITLSHAALNHLGIRITRWITDFSGYWILIVATGSTVLLLIYADTLDFTRLITFTNFTGIPEEAPIWPRTESVGWALMLGLLLPAYTITGFDASAHVAEETLHAGVNVPRGIVRSVIVSGVFGWILLSAVVLAMKCPAECAAAGEGAFTQALFGALPRTIAWMIFVGALIAQYICGLATVTSASRMAFAFARDGGLPASHVLRSVSPRFQTPAVAIWTVSLAAILFTLYTPVYSTITAVCVIFLYISYVIPTAIGLIAWGRWWREPGPWHLGLWFRPLAVISVLSCVLILIIGIQPPNEQAAIVVGGMLFVLGMVWLTIARKHFPGPPHFEN